MAALAGAFLLLIVVNICWGNNWIDSDMAAEMTNFTSQQVITQAANSMLAQANQLPEKVLQLLQ